MSFIDLKTINQQYASELVEASKRVTNSEWYHMEKELVFCEESVTAYNSVKYAVGSANGLDALHLVLKAWKEMGPISDGDEIIVPANTYIASVFTITGNNLEPVFCEPDMNAYNIDIS